MSIHDKEKNDHIKKDPSSIKPCPSSAAKKMIEIFMTKGYVLATVIAGISLILTAAGILPNYCPVVSTENGQVQGRIQYSRNGTAFWSFRGIPFAQPPLGELRFEPPHPLNKSWTGVRQASSYPPFCLQMDVLVRGRLYGEEDCLYLNVFTSDIKRKKPVMLYIHGGGFLSGASSMYRPDYFMDHEDIVIVTINYRLGPLGYMNTGDGIFKGNQGMKDQLLAMKWVKANIANFGGDPDRVTLFGESAGAASVHYHILSPASTGLFHRAIIQSGAVTCPWSFMKNPREVSLKYIKHLDCPIENATELVQCLKTMDPTKIVELQANLMHPVTDFLLFVPSAENENDENAFLTENPRKLLKAGKVSNRVPIMLGVTSGEGALRTARLDAVPEAIPELDDSWDLVAPKVLAYENYDGKRDNVAGKIRNFYFGNESFVEDLHEFKKNFTKMASDSLFFEPIHRAAKLHAEQGDSTHLYFYNYNSVILPSLYSLLRAVRHDDWIFSEAKLAIAILVDLAKENIFRSKGPHEFGATHADDLFQLWNMEGLTGYFSGPDTDFSMNIVKSFVDFARNEEPLHFNGVPWPPVQLTKEKGDGSATPPALEFKYMLLDNEPRMISEPFADRMPFWESLKIRDS